MALFQGSIDSTQQPMENPFGTGPTLEQWLATAVNQPREWWTQKKERMPAYYESIKQYDPWAALDAQAARDASLGAAIAQAQAANPTVSSTPMPSTEEQEAQLRQNALNQLSGIFGPTFEETFAPSSLLTGPSENVYGTQRGKAQDYINRLVRRRLVTPSGEAAGGRALEAQAPGVRSKISDVGNLLLEQERAKIRDIANRAKSTASNLTLGQTFDPELYRQEALADVAGFQRGLGDALSAGLPPGDLFNVSPAGGAAGYSPGSVGLAVDPIAVSGGEYPGTGEAVGATPPPTARRRGRSEAF